MDCLDLVCPICITKVLTYPYFIFFSFFQQTKLTSFQRQLSAFDHIDLFVHAAFKLSQLIFVFGVSFRSLWLHSIDSWQRQRRVSKVKSLTSFGLRNDDECSLSWLPASCSTATTMSSFSEAVRTCAVSWFARESKAMA